MQIRSLIRPVRVAINLPNLYQRFPRVIMGPSVRLMSTPSLPNDETDVDMKHVEQMQEYFNQYIDEYYEVEEDDVSGVEEEETISKVREEDVELRSLEEATVAEIVSVLEENRAIDISCVDIPLEAKAPHRHMIICSPYNNRHAEALTNVVRQYVKKNFYFEDTPPRRVRNNGRWFVFDMKQIVIHVLTEELRAKYSLETLWLPEEENGEHEYDDMIPPLSNEKR